MNSEDFFVFAYPALIILGVLLSLIPAYVAFKKDKNFWLWWISTAIIFTILLLVVVRVRAFSLLIYLLAILPVASILALLPSQSHKRVSWYISNIWTAIKSDRLYGVYWCLFVLILAGILYYYLLPHEWDDGRYGNEFYPAILAFVFLMACLGYVLFIFVLSEKGKKDVFRGFLLTVLLSIPVLADPSHTMYVLRIGNLVAPELGLGSVIAALKSNLVGGIFILFGLCSVPAAALILFNNKYGIVNIIASILRSDDYSPPYIHFSRIPFPTTILVFSLLFIVFFKEFFDPNESWMFLFPLVYLCLIFPMLLLSFAGIVLSSIVIGISVNQKKSLYAFGIPLCGLLASWDGISVNSYRNFLGVPGTLLMFYGMTSGLVALILWVISDFRGPGKINDTKP